MHLCKWIKSFSRRTTKYSLSEFTNLVSEFMYIASSESYANISSSQTTNITGATGPVTLNAFSGLLSHSMNNTLFGAKTGLLDFSSEDSILSQTDGTLNVSGEHGVILASEDILLNSTNRYVTWHSLHGPTEVVASLSTSILSDEGGISVQTPNDAIALFASSNVGLTSTHGSVALSAPRILTTASNVQLASIAALLSLNDNLLVTGASVALDSDTILIQGPALDLHTSEWARIEAQNSTFANYDIRFKRNVARRTLCCNRVHGCRRFCGYCWPSTGHG